MQILRKCALFQDMQEADIQALLQCLSAEKKRYGKQEFILHAQEQISSVGILLKGMVQILQEDFWGNRGILTILGPGELFGEAFSCAEMDQIPVSVLAVEETELLLIDYRKIITTCAASCVFHTKLIRNMLRILANKNIMLTQKMEYVTKRTTRDKLLSYLSAQAVKAGSRQFEIPFNRQELADYLCVERSAMSNQLSKLQEEGILAFHKNQFEFMREPGLE